MSKETLAQIVSGSSWKQEAFLRLGDNIYLGAAQYDEKALGLTIPMSPERAGLIAEEKALKDVQTIGVLGAIDQLTQAGFKGEIQESTSLVRLYTDVIQVVDGKALEKPHPNLIQWIQSEDALVQSGKKVEIITALTGINVTHLDKRPQTVFVRVTAQMRHYTKEDLIAYARHGGVHNMLNTAGGLSLLNGGRAFYDTSCPMTVYLHEDLEKPGVEIARYTDWQQNSAEVLLPAVTGAYREAVDMVLAKCSQEQGNVA